jgi:hypothetical protein
MTDFRVVGFDCQAVLANGTTAENLRMCVRDDRIFYMNADDEVVEIEQMTGGNFCCLPNELALIIARDREAR